MSFKFESLRVWQRSIDLSGEIFELTEYDQSENQASHANAEPCDQERAPIDSMKGHRIQRRHSQVSFIGVNRDRAEECGKNYDCE